MDQVFKTLRYESGIAVEPELVTIILTTLNSERFLARSIDSCLVQTYPNLEVIVVDGASTDATLEIVSAYDDPRIRLIHQVANEGRLPGALNLGMSKAQGKFITWIQDDSWFVPDALKVMVEFLRNRPEVSLVYTDYWDVDEHEQVLQYQRVNSPEPKNWLCDDVIRQSFLSGESSMTQLDLRKRRIFRSMRFPGG
jgi:glycosyltransferase involved in cell wall biosynthesis